MTVILQYSSSGIRSWLHPVWAGVHSTPSLKAICLAPAPRFHASYVFLTLFFKIGLDDEIMEFYSINRDSAYLISVVLFVLVFFPHSNAKYNLFKIV